MLKIAIEKALKKSPNADLSGSLFDKIHDIREHQFVGFVSSDTIKNNVLNSFHLHSFVTFYTDRHKETIITCILTTRHHIQSNMQDRLMQLVQLIQYAKNGALSMSVSNEVLNVAITTNDLRAYESLGFDTASFQNYDESFSLNIKKLIPMVQYRDSNTWAKYCPRLIKLDFYKKCQIKKDLHGTLRSRMIEFLQTDIAETPTYSMNPNIVGEVQQFLLNIVDLDLDKQLLSSMWDRHLENKETNEKIWEKLGEIATNATSIPFSIFTKMMNLYSGKLKFLESTIELLQQFTLEMIESSDQFLIFPGDGCKFKLKCTRCGKFVTHSESIGRILSIAPYALLSHLDITLLTENENDVSDNLEVIPILFTSHKNYETVKASFVESSKNGKKVSFSCHAKKIDWGNFCFVKLLRLMIHYLMMS